MADLPLLLALVPTSDQPALREAARQAGMRLEAFHETGPFLAVLGEASPRATLLSLSVDGLDAPLALRLAREIDLGVLFLAAARPGLDHALLMEKVGAFSILPEPLVPEAVAQSLGAMEDEGAVVAVPVPEPSDPDGRPTLKGEAPAMAALFQRIARVAATPSTVLLSGESGTGKEVVARTIHWASPRRTRPFVAVNCAAIPEQLLESELFGHERGAFTGAVSRRAGRIERADGGTLFLDEIGDMSPLLQAKILRVLEERAVEPVGGAESKDVDVRLVAATHRDLRARIEAGEFREDLFYRLAVVELHLPPLREREADVGALALHFAGTFAARYGRSVRGITREALAQLEAYPWPGNVRELRNVMDRAVVLAPGDVIRASDVRIGPRSPRASSRPSTGLGGGYPTRFSLEEVERDHIRRVLDECGGHMGRAAEVLGIHRNTLTRKVRDHGLDPEREGG